LRTSCAPSSWFKASRRGTATADDNERAVISIDVVMESFMVASSRQCCVEVKKEYGSFLFSFVVAFHECSLQIL
jgi:hypothetical protein